MKALTYLFFIAATSVGQGSGQFEQSGPRFLTEAQVRQRRKNAKHKQRAYLAFGQTGERGKIAIE